MIQCRQSGAKFERDILQPALVSYCKYNFHCFPNVVAVVDYRIACSKTTTVCHCKLYRLIRPTAFIIRPHRSFLLIHYAACGGFLSLFFDALVRLPKQSAPARQQLDCQRKTACNAKQFFRGLLANLRLKGAVIYRFVVFVFFSAPV